MEAAIYVSICVALLVAIFVPFVLSGKWVTAAEDKARARRLADAKRNARLLRLNL